MLKLISLKHRKVKDKMQISDIRIRKILQDGRLRAVVSLTLDDAIAIHDIKLVQGDDRLFVAMPSRRDESGVFRDIVHPINPDARKKIEESILAAYEAHISALENAEPEVSETEETE